MTGEDDEDGVHRGRDERGRYMPKRKADTLEGLGARGGGIPLPSVVHLQSTRLMNSQMNELYAVMSVFSISMSATACNICGDISVLTMLHFLHSAIEAEGGAAVGAAASESAEPMVRDRLGCDMNRACVIGGACLVFSSWDVDCSLHLSGGRPRRRWRGNACPAVFEQAGRMQSGVRQAEGSV